MVYMKLVLIPLNRVIVIEFKRYKKLLFGVSCVLIPLNRVIVIEFIYTTKTLCLPMKSLNPLLVKRSGCFSNHSLREIVSLLLNKGIVKRREPNGFVLIPLNRVIVIEYIK